MCRRCSDCQNMSHHWMWNSAYTGEIDAAEFCCKHCNALGDTCAECHGDGCAPSYGEEDPPKLHPEYGMGPSPCPECDGEGVILCAGGDVVFSRQLE